MDADAWATALLASGYEGAKKLASQNELGAAFVLLVGNQLGVMFSRKLISGSCGGLARLKGIDCGVCELKKQCEIERRKREKEG